MQRKLLIIGLPVLGAALIVGIGIASAASTTAAGATTGVQVNGGPGGPGGSRGGFGGRFGGGFGAMSATDYATNQATEFQNEASALGLSVNVITNGWAQGQTLEQIATANGISATQFQTDLSTYRTTQLTAQLQALVTNGTITQSQMSTRLAYDEAQTAKMQNGRGHGLRSPPAAASAATPATATQ